MYLLTFIQNGKETSIALFESMESGRSLAERIPGYRIWREEIEGYTYVYESFEPAELPDYMELEHRGNRIPLTRFMFPDEEEVDIFWRELINVDEKGSGLIEGATAVDAYVVNNAEAEAYIKRREANYCKVSSLLQEMGYETERACRGSEDGEAIVVRQSGAGDWHFFSHMDPFFVEELPENEEELRRWAELQLGIV